MSVRPAAWARLAVVVALLAGLGAGAVQGPTTRVLDGDEAPCPSAEDVVVHGSARVSTTNGVLSGGSTLEVRATGVEPESPPYGSVDVDAAQGLLRCILSEPDRARLTSYEWSGGDASFELDLGAGEPHFGGVLTPSGVQERRPAALDLSGQRSQLSLDLCPDPSSPALVCSRAVSGWLRLTVGDLGDGNASGHRVVASPSPTRVLPSDRGSRTYEWRLSAAPSRVSVAFETSWLRRAAAFLTSQSAFDVVLVRVGSAQVGLDAHFMSYAASVLLALGVAMAVLSSPRARRCAAAVLVAAVGFGALRAYGGPADSSGMLTASTTWALVTLLARPRGRWLAAVPVVVLCALVAAAVDLTRRADLDAGAAVPAYGALETAGLVAGVLALTLTGASTIGGRALEALQLLPTSSRAHGTTRRAVRAGFTAAAAFAVGFPFGALVFQDPLGRDTSRSATLLREVVVASSALGSTLVGLAALVIVALVTVEVRSSAAPRGELVPPRDVVVMIALAAAVSSPWLLTGSSLFGVTLPLWLVTFLILRAGLLTWARRRPRTALWEGRAALALRGAMAAQAARNRVTELDKQVDGSAVTLDAVHEARRRVSSTFPGDPVRRYLEWGHSGSWRRNGERAALLGSALAAVPVAYFVWSTLAVTSGRVTWSTGLLVLMISVSVEGARWIVLSFSFGALYALLPGRSGPLKALALSATWLAGAVVAELVSRALGAAPGTAWLYRSLQLVVFLAVLAVAYDVMTVRRGGGGWRQLRELYAIRTYADLTAATVPVVLAVIALAQQLLSGSGLDVAESFVSGLGSVFGRP